MRIDHVTTATDDLETTVAFYPRCARSCGRPAPGIPLRRSMALRIRSANCTSQSPRCRGHSDAALDVVFYTDDFSRACLQTLAQDRKAVVVTRRRMPGRARPLPGLLILPS